MSNQEPEITLGLNWLDVGNVSDIPLFIASRVCWVAGECMANAAYIDDAVPESHMTTYRDRASGAWFLKLDLGRLSMTVDREVGSLGVHALDISSGRWHAILSDLPLEDPTDFLEDATFCRFGKGRKYECFAQAEQVLAAHQAEMNWGIATVVAKGLQSLQLRLATGRWQ